MNDFAKRLWKARGLWLRILFCWLLGTCFVFFDEVKDYDLRFRLRGPQESAKQIVLVFFDQDDWTAYHGQSNNLIRSLKEFQVITDSFFWRAKTWDSLLGKILEQNPKSIGVTFFFSDQLPRPDESHHALFDPRVLWAGQLDNEGRPALPLMAGSYGSNVALVDLREDEDRVLRRFSSPLAPLPHMGLKLSESLTGTSLQEMNAYLGDNRLINYRGSKNVFTAVSALAVLQNRIPPGFFKDKIVLIGSHSVGAHQYQTPLGQMSRTDILAQIVDNVIAKRWISRLNFWLCSLYQLAILLLAVFILMTYPQAVAFVFLLWLGLGVTALSIWVFDSYYFWLPALSPLLLALSTYVIFLGYQLSVKENQTWRLEQEKSLLSELDQLRNNFISLISHDLKTPIAKIQAICDRLLSGAVSDEVKDGLGSLRKESVELHRYIQSILQISRLESSQVVVRKEACDINELVENVIRQLKPLFMDRRQTVEVKLEPMFSIEVDSLMIQEVILNLIENAIKYTPNDGHILVQTNEVEDKAIFSVKDNGPGISKADQEHIFEKFYRGQAQLSQIKGTGLGLFLVKYFIELHGGEVFLESEVNKGTRVGFTLPLQT
ncbi:MAG: CHASE2 domain-containing protein [Bdellovibrionales bacterium]